jgi:methyl-accepting chemotaxis protein
VGIRDGVRPEGAHRVGARFGIGLKLASIFCGILVVLGAATVSVVTARMRTMLEREFHSKGVGISKSLATGAVDWLIADERSKIQGSIDDFRQIEGVRFIALTNAEGVVINHTIAPSFPEELRLALTAGLGEPTMKSRQINATGVGPVLAISAPVLSGELGWAHVGMDLELVAAASSRLALQVALVFLAFLVIGTLAALWSMRQVLRPLGRIVNVLGNVSKGDLTISSSVRSSDELALVSSSTDTMVSALSNLVTSIRAASSGVASSAEEILATMQSQEQGAAEQTVSLEEVTASMNRLQESAGTIADRASHLNEAADHMSASVRAGNASLDATRDTMGQIVTSNRTVSERIEQLYQQSQSIIAVVDIIDDISDRLDLLALNAALEGSRAGDLGKGFSLVAQEMRRLAENVVGSTKQIKATIQEIQRLVQSSLEASRASSRTSDDGAGEVEKLVVVMQQVVDTAERTTEAARQITVSTQQQLSSSDQMLAAMREVSAVTTEGLAGAQQATRAARDLAALAGKLRSMVEVFKLGQVEN